jgi:hypothetical protein
LYSPNHSKSLIGMGRCKGWGNKPLKSLNISSTPLGSSLRYF